MSFSNNKDDWDDSLLMDSLMTAINQHKEIRSNKNNKDLPLKRNNTNNYNKNNNNNINNEDNNIKQNIGGNTKEKNNKKKSRLEQFEDALCSSYPLPDENNNHNDNQNINQNTIPSSSLLDGPLQEMLLSWYNSGYYTGRYEVLKELQELGISIPPHLLSTTTTTNTDTITTVTSTINSSTEKVDINDSNSTQNIC